jgi:hypothetical protein
VNAVETDMPMPPLQSRMDKRGSFKIFAIALFTICATSAILLSTSLWNGRQILVGKTGHWIFVPSNPSSKEHKNGLIYPDEGASADELYPDFFKAYTDQGTWVYLRSPDDRVEDEIADSKLPSGVNWGSLDCGFYGPKYESRALGCDRPGSASSG